MDKPPPYTSVSWQVLKLDFSCLEWEYPSCEGLIRFQISAPRKCLTRRDKIDLSSTQVTTITASVMKASKGLLGLRHLCFGSTILVVKDPQPSDRAAGGLGWINLHSWGAQGPAAGTCPCLYSPTHYQPPDTNCESAYPLPPTLNCGRRRTRSSSVFCCRKRSWRTTASLRLHRGQSPNQDCN